MPQKDAESAAITYAIGVLKDGADGTEDSDWDKVASDLTETSYTIPASTLRAPASIPSACARCAAAR